MSVQVSPLLTRVLVSISVLAERRQVLYVGIDVVLLFSGLVAALVGGAGSGRDFWLPMVLLPSLAIGVPMMSDAVAVERRAGTLDLALSSPGSSFYFERRVGAVAALIVAQGWLSVLLIRSVVPPFPLSGPLVQVVSVALFLAFLTMNFALRLKTPGAVMFATLATAIALSKWLFSNPVHPPTENGQGPMTTAEIIGYVQDNLVLLAGAAIAYLFARQRLSRPEAIIR